jgi:DNA transformation protein
MVRRPAARKLPASVSRFLHLTAPIGPVEAKPMFGGHGFYLDGLIFAIEADGEIWLKVDAETRPAFDGAGSRPFVYQGKYKPVEMPYWTMPAAAAHGGRSLQRWVGLALAAARRSAGAKRTPARRRARSDRDFI